MTIAAYVPLAAAILNGLLLLFVLRAGVQGTSRFAYLVWGTSIVVWNLGTFQMFRVKDADAALDWARFLQAGVIFLPISLFHLCLDLCGFRRSSRRWVVFVPYLFGIALAGTLFTRWFVKSVRPAGYAFYSEGGPAFWVFVGLYAILTALTLFFLWRAKESATHFRRGQLRSLLWATGILIAGGNNDILPILGVTEYPIIGKPIFPIGSICAIFYGILVGYSVLQHQLMDIRLGLSRFAAHGARLSFLFLIGFVLMLIISLIVPEGEISHTAFWCALLVLVLSGFTASRYMPKLLGAGTESFEHRLLGDHFEYQDRTRVFIETCRWHTEMEELFTDLHSLLLNTLGARGYTVVLRDEISRSFSIVRSHPPGAQGQIAQLSSDASVFRFFASSKTGCLPLGEDYANESDRLECAAREQLKSLRGVLAFPFLVEQQPLGILVLDEKTNGRSYTKTDIQLLAELATNVALVINQILLKNQLLQARELDLLGRMSQGMAHDLNNLTTPVWTLLQLLTEGVPAETLRTDLAPIAMRNIRTMREYIREALFFSENLRPDFQTGRLDLLVQEVVERSRENKRKGKLIEYTLRLCGDMPVEMDYVLISRLLSNVIANAVDASPQGGRIDVETIRLVKTDLDRDWFRVRVTDHGTGISEANMHRLFQPYFTTKKTGDEDRGFGLGLAICRRIALLHGGNLVVSSEEGVGTIVNLDLPSCQKRPKAQPQPALLTTQA